MKNTKLIIFLSLLTILTILTITSCSDNKAKEELSNTGAEKKVQEIKPLKILSIPELVTQKKRTTNVFEADMKNVEKLLNEWSAAYDSDNKQYSENTYCMLMLARTLLTNKNMLPEHKMKIIDEYNRKQLKLADLPINVRTNKQRVNQVLQDHLYWPYPAHGALYLVLKSIVNNENADEKTKSEAYTRLAQINHYFYRHDDEALFYLNAFNSIPVEMEKNRMRLLNKIVDAQNNIWDENERISTIKKAVDGIGDNYDKSNLKISLCEAYTRCGDFGKAREVFNEIRQNSSVNNNNQFNKLEKCISEKKTVYRRMETWRYTGKSINEIPNIRIDWETFAGRDVISFKQYFSTLLDELINAEKNK